MDQKSSDESHKEVTTQEGKQRATCAEQRNPRNSAKDRAPQERCQLRNVRGLFSAKVSNSSFAEVRMGLLIEPTHVEDEDEEQELEKEDERETVKSAE